MDALKPISFFICHASEDKEFVRPLAEALRKEYERVWYDEYELRLGDPLLQKIDEGLASCDYGIVVLSKAFFVKKWPPAELDGLFGRETPSRKIILPIWKNVTEHDVRTESPILAGRKAVSTTAGLPEVLNQIRFAVDVDERRQELTPLDRAVQRVKVFRRTVADKQHSDGVLRSEQGVALVSRSIENLWDTIQRLLSGDLEPTAPIKFRYTKPAPYIMDARTVRGMGLNLHATNVCLNSVADTRLKAKIFQIREEPFTTVILYETEFQPVVRSGDQIVWLNPPATYTTEEVAAYLIEQFLREVEIATE
jgi:TIR domain